MQKTALCKGDFIALWLRPDLNVRLTCATFSFTSQMLRVMRLTVLFILVLSLHVSATTRAQIVNLSGKRLSLIKVFTTIEKQTGYVVFGNLELLKKTNSLSLSIQNMPLKKALEIILRDQPLRFRLDGNTIFLAEKGKKETEHQTDESTIHVFNPITGKIMTSEGRPLAGISIAVKGRDKGTISATDGSFNLDVLEGDVLIFSSVGYQTKEVVIKGFNPLQIILAVAVLNMEEVTVSTGYYKRKKASFTGSASAFSGEELRVIGTQNLIKSLSVLEPSFRMVENLDLGANPNQLPESILRGPSGIPDLNANYKNAPNLPLFILDGFETTVQKVYDLNMNIIASVTLLKDASAKAIYGSKAGNGVVVIETIRPVNGNLRISYTGGANISAPDLSSYNLTNSVQKIQAEQLAGVYSNNYPANQFRLTGVYGNNMKEALSGVNTYWLAQPLQNGVGQRHNISIDGGSGGIQYYAGVSYNNITGVMKGSKRETITGVINLEYRKSKFAFRNNLSIDRNKGVNSPYGSFSEYTRLNPYWRIHDTTGKLIRSYNDGRTVNPLYNVQLNTKDFTQYTTITENFYAEWDPVKSLRLTARTGITMTDNSSDFFIPAQHTRYATITETSPLYLTRGEYTVSNGKQKMITADLSAAYSFTFNKSEVFANLIYSVQSSGDHSNGMTMVGFPNDKMDDISMGAQYLSGSKAVGSEGSSRTLGITSAVNYSYDNRYLADFSYRASGSSQFGSDNRWGAFWSAGLGWNIHKEAFLAKNSFINQLRLRGSMGMTGTQNFDPYQSIATYGYVPNQIYNGEMGITLLSMHNPNLRWQQIFDKNIGIDILFFKKLNVRMEYYLKDTKDLLTDQTAAPSSGFNSYKENVGETRNKGFEMYANYRILNLPSKRMSLSVFASVAHNNNKIRKISESLRKLNSQQDQLVSGTDINSIKPVTRFEEGQSMTSIWAIQSLGIDPVNGKEIYVKRDGTISYVWSVNDQVVVGDLMPKYNGSFGANFKIYGFSFNLACNFQLGGQMYNSTLVSKVENANIDYNVDIRFLEGRWKTPGQISLYKNITDRTYTKPTSRFVQDNNELILSSIGIAYDFSGLNFIKNSLVKGMTLNATVNDLARIGSVKMERGISYPYARMIAFSLYTNF